MKDPRLVQDYLRDILDAMDKAEEFIGDLDLHAFSRDDKTAGKGGYPGSATPVDRYAGKDAGGRGLKW